MKNKIFYAPEAEKDLNEILEYISFELDNQKAAFDMVEGIIHLIDKLEAFPKMGTELSAIIEFENDYRFLVHKKYMIFYRAEEASVYIDRILYNRRDYIRILFSQEEENKSNAAE